MSAAQLTSLQRGRSRRIDRHQAGLTLIELMVGIAIGLLLIGGATTLFLSNLDSSRRLLLEARLNQNVRAAAELITRDLRRAGYWNEAVDNVRMNTENPMGGVVQAGNSVQYTFSAPTGSSGTVKFLLQDSKLGMDVGGGAQDLTDPAVAKVTRFAIHPSINENKVRNPVVASSGSADKCVFVRRYDITIEAEAPSDASIKRVIKTAARVRNDHVTSCLSP